VALSILLQVNAQVECAGGGHPLIGGVPPCHGRTVGTVPRPGTTAGGLAPGATVVDTLDDALDLARQEAIPDDGLDRSEIWIIGGAQVFRDALPFADKAYVTQISMHVDADTYAPDIASLAESGAWRMAEEGVWQGTQKGSDDIAGFRFVTYEKNREE